MAPRNAGNCTSVAIAIISTTLIFVLLCAEVQSTIEITHRLKKTKVFESTSDITVKRVRQSADEDSHSKSYLVLSEPAEACQVPKGPPTIPKENFHTTSNSAAESVPPVPNIKWILLVSGGGCDFRTKAVYAATSNYSGIIVKHINPDDVSGYQDLHSDDVAIVIDMVLLSPDEWDNVTRFVHPKPYMISLGAHEDKQDENQESIIYTWAADLIYSVIYWPIEIFAEAIRALVDTLHAFVIRPVSSVVWKVYSMTQGVIFAIGYLLFLFYSWKFVMRRFSTNWQPDPTYRNFYSNNRYNYTNNGYYREEAQWEYVDNSESDGERERERERLLLEALVAEYRKMQLHKITLGISDPITEEKVKDAFKSLSLRHHPDKNPNLTGRALEQCTQRFQAILTAKTELLKYLEKRDAREE